MAASIGHYNISATRRNTQASLISGTSANVTSSAFTWGAFLYLALSFNFTVAGSYGDRSIF